MKNLFYILVLITGFANAQIVNIPDANFKAKLLQADTTNQIALTSGSQSVKIDTNNDGEIQVSETFQVANLQVANSSISDLTGISDFTNLISLGCDNNNLTSINVSANVSLQWLSLSQNQLTSLDVIGLTALQNLNCSFNSIAALDVSNLTSLYLLNCSENQIVSLDVSGDISLFYLYCGNNSISTLDISGLTSLTNFGCAGNTQMTSLNLTGATSLRTLDCQGNQLATLDLSNLSALQSVGCAHNLLTQIILANNTMLFDLNCGYNLLTNFNANGPNVQNLDVTGNMIVSLDLSNDLNLYTVFVGSNPLEYLNIKNGRNVSINFSGPNSNLQFVCAEESNLINTRNNLISMGYLTTVASSYCTFTPGGHYNTINGTVTFDANNSGCDSNDLFQPYIRIGINDGTTTGASFTNIAGNYIFYTQAGSFTVTPNIENPTWFNFSPATVTIPFADNNDNVVNQNFCIAANGFHPDAEVVIAPNGRARPGFDAQYIIVYKNKGNQTLSGNITFTYDDGVLDFVSSTIIPSAQTTGQLTFDYTNLLPFESRYFYITLHVNGPTDAPAVNIGDQLDFSAIINPIDGDETPTDNALQFNQTVVGSFDPNDITCIEGNMVSPSEIGNYLHYIINFENTGTADAENIVVRDVIDTTQFDVNSLQLLNSSAPVTAKLTGNVAEFIFPNINLHSGGHGNILIKIKSKNTLTTGATVSKRANIYFDYNFPVDTNLENTTFQALSNPDYETDASISVYPNPSNGNVNINCNNNIKSVQLFDVQGRLLETDLINQTNTVIDISGKSKGVYFLKIISDKGIGVEKIVRK